MPIKLKNTECSVQSVVHSLPCSTDANCKAEVNKYFKPTGSDEALTASLRGYPLNGLTVKLPPGFTGLVVETPPDSETAGDDDDDDNELKTYLTCRSKFHSLTYWNWDQIPSRNDKFIACLDWLEISKAIHDSTEDADS